MEERSVDVIYEREHETVSTNGFVKYPVEVKKKLFLPR